jgi:hypothetical protein
VDEKIQGLLKAIPQRVTLKNLPNAAIGLEALHLDFARKLVKMEQRATGICGRN